MRQPTRRGICGAEPLGLLDSVRVALDMRRSERVWVDTLRVGSGGG
jgi:hypothetical protein